MSGLGGPEAGSQVVVLFSIRTSPGDLKIGVGGPVGDTADT